MIPRRLPVDRLLALAVLLMMGSPSPAGDEDVSYFFMVFAYQGTPNRGKDSHTFATFVRVQSGEESGVVGREVHSHTISWLPERIDLRVYNPLPEKGRNFTLEETLEITRTRNLRVTMWGPYRIEKKLYDRSVKEARRLESGTVLYKSIDFGYPTNIVSNCIHAVSDLIWMPTRLRVWTPAYGEAASYRVLLRLRPFITRPRQEEDWILDAIGLDGSAISRRDIRDWTAWFPNWR